MRRCDWCGEEFSPWRRDQRLCCKRCHDDWFKEERRAALQAWREREREQEEGAVA